MTHKVDTNQAEIVEALRAVGASVQSLAMVGHGVPDLLVAYRGDLFLFEVKAPSLIVLTENERNWHANWHSPVHIITTVDAALHIIGAVEA